MDAARLQEVSEALFEGQPWRKALAGYLDLDESTVWRWTKQNRVPMTVEIAMEQSFRWGLYKKPEGAK
jgi:hypothetical protein